MASVDPREFCSELVGEGLDFFAGVPDSLLKDFCACLADVVPAERNVIAANEGAAVGMACGYHLATGHVGVVYMQNSGEGNAVNPLLSLADPEVYAVPMLLVIGWRGEPGVRDEPQHAKQGRVTCELLEAMGVPYEVLDEEGWRPQLSALVKVMRAESRPVALVVRKGTFSSHPFAAEAGGYPMTREGLLEAVLGQLGEGDFTVATTGKEGRELFELREARGEGHDHDFLTVGGMGHASSIAFGLALGADADVWCLDGDGAFLMHMGSLAVAGQKAPSNFKYVLNCNGAHESVGGQPNVGFAVDASAILRACGFDVVVEASTPDEVVDGVHVMRDAGPAAMVVRTRQGSRSDLGRPAVPPRDNKAAMMRALEPFRRGE